MQLKTIFEFRMYEIIEKALQQEAGRVMQKHTGIDEYYEKFKDNPLSDIGAIETTSKRLQEMKEEHDTLAKELLTKARTI